MDPIFLLLRLVHVLLGVYWAGTIFFFASFLMPTLGDVGPDAPKFMGALLKRRYAEVMPIIAILTVLTGLFMYYRVSGGFASEYMKSPRGMGYGAGGAAAIVALGFGMAIIRPTANRLGELMQKMPAMTAGTERESAMAEVKGLRERMASGSKLVTILLLIAVVFMAISRYL